MRAVLFAGVAFALYYAGGFYHVEALVVLAAALAAVLAAMAALALWARAHVRASVRPIAPSCARGGVAAFLLRVENGSRLPVFSFDARLRCSYRAGQLRDGSLEASGGVDGRSATEAPLYVEVPHCGVVEADLLRLAVHDPLGIFSLPVRADIPRRAGVAVLPHRGGAVFAEGALEDVRAAVSAEREVPRPGPEPPDVYDVHDYRPGDHLHDIHWKLSARTEEIQAKTYADERRDEVALHLVLDARRPIAPEELDAFYAAALALLEALLDTGLACAVSWDGMADPGAAGRHVEQHGEVPGLMARLVGEAVPRLVDGDSDPAPAKPRAGLSLDLSLRVAWGGKTLAVLRGIENSPAGEDS